MLPSPVARPVRAVSRIAWIAGLSLFAPDVWGDERFQVPEGCGSRAEFERDLERLLGAEQLEPSAYELTIAPERDGTYHLRMTVRGEQRKLRDPDCRTLFKSAVVVAAASVKPELLTAPSEATPPEPAPSNEAPEAPASASEPVRTSEPPAPRESDPSAAWRGSVGAGGGAVAGLVPGLAPLVELRALAERVRFGGQLGLRYVALGTEEVAGERGAEVRTIGGRAAPHYRPVDFVRLSAGPEVDLMFGRGTNVTTPLSDVAWSVAAGAEIAIIPLSIAGLELEIALQGRWALLRPRFRIEGFGDAYRVPEWGGGGVVRASVFVF